jgi:hypothetical protein
MVNDLGRGDDTRGLRPILHRYCGLRPILHRYCGLRPILHRYCGLRPTLLTPLHRRLRPAQRPHRYSCERGYQRNRDRTAPQTATAPRTATVPRTADRDRHRDRTSTATRRSATTSGTATAQHGDRDRHSTARRPRPPQPRTRREASSRWPSSPALRAGCWRDRRSRSVVGGFAPTASGTSGPALFGSLTKTILARRDRGESSRSTCHPTTPTTARTPTGCDLPATGTESCPNTVRTDSHVRSPAVGEGRGDCDCRVPHPRRKAGWPPVATRLIIEWRHD